MFYYYYFIGRQVTGELFAQTSRTHPFNILPNSTESNQIISRDVYRRDATIDVLPNSNVLQRLKERILKYVFQDASYD